MNKKMIKLLPSYFIRVLSLGFCLGGAPAFASDEKVMLFDYYERMVGTEEQMPYTERVLYPYNDDLLLMQCYLNGGMPDEKVVEYLVPRSVLDELMEIVRKFDMKKWNNRDDTDSIEGEIFVCKFRDEDGAFVRVSSECMPSDGSMAFSEVARSLVRYANENNLKQ